jgi:hypothetical protein
MRVASVPVMAAAIDSVMPAATQCVTTPGLGASKARDDHTCSILEFVDDEELPQSRRRSLCNVGGRSRYAQGRE